MNVLRHSNLIRQSVNKSNLFKFAATLEKAQSNEVASRLLVTLHSSLSLKPSNTRYWKKSSSNTSNISLLRSDYNLTVYKCFSCTSNANNNNIKNDQTYMSNALTIKKSQRLMRQIYARVHPDLFTNHLEAQKLNEDSLKILRNLIDHYATSQAGTAQIQSSKLYLNPDKRKHIQFYYKQNSMKESEVMLKKFQVDLISKNYYTIEDQLESIFDQFIENLNLSSNKFNTGKKVRRNQNDARKLPSFLRSHGNQKYRVTYKNVKKVNFDFDDQFIDDDEFEKWYEENAKKNAVPSLRKWFNDNKSKIELRIKDATLLKQQLRHNMDTIIRKWKLNDIIIRNNWSLQTSNSYLLGMLNFGSLDFKGFTLVLTDRNQPGLQKNGHVYLNCDQVFEEWLFILGFAKKEVKLLEEISEMEANLSTLLNGIKLCDDLEKRSFLHLNDDVYIDSARYYHTILDGILNRFTSEIGNDRPLFNNDFSMFKMTFQKVKYPELNSIGQFVIGNSNRISYNQTIEFINNNQRNSRDLYKKHLQLLDEENKILNIAKNKLEISKIKFQEGIGYQQRLTSMEQLISLAKNQTSHRHNPLDTDALNMLKRVDLYIGSAYALNDDASIQIPWNWFEFDRNNG